MKNNWNVGEDKKLGIARKTEKAVLVGVTSRYQSESQVIEYLDELEFLAQTAGANSMKRFIQKLDRPDSRFYIRKGKVLEIAQFVEDHNIDMVIFDDDLTGKQTNNLEEKFKVKIIDRSTLILDIFASRAQTAQAKTQVELAQIQYLLPKLRGLWTHLERQKGGIGMRGPGEQEIETDRRIIRDKITLLKAKLEKIDKQNITRRKTRGKQIRVSLVGYTNVGKSTLMNALSKSDVFAENKLFATLDTTVRKVVFGNMPFLLSDTVGFIRKLPHHLIESFKSTLDEVRECDILIHVVDVSHPSYEDQMNTVMKTLNELNAKEKSTFIVLNKIDVYRKEVFDKYLDEDIKKEMELELVKTIEANYQCDAILVSALHKENFAELRTKLSELVKEKYLSKYPYQSAGW